MYTKNIYCSSMCTVYACKRMSATHSCICSSSVICVNCSLWLCHSFGFRVFCFITPVVSMYVPNNQTAHSLRAEKKLNTHKYLSVSRFVAGSGLVLWFLVSLFYFHVVFAVLLFYNFIIIIVNTWRTIFRFPSKMNENLRNHIKFPVKLPFKQL